MTNEEVIYNQLLNKYWWGSTNSKAQLSSIVISSQKIFCLLIHFIRTSRSLILDLHAKHQRKVSHTFKVDFTDRQRLYSDFHKDMTIKLICGLLVVFLSSLSLVNLYSQQLTKMTSLLLLRRELGSQVLTWSKQQQKRTTSIKFITTKTGSTINSSIQIKNHTHTR